MNDRMPLCEAEGQRAVRVNDHIHRWMSHRTTEKEQSIYVMCDGLHE